MRIDYIITGLEIGGAEYQVVTLLEKLKKKGYQVRVIYLKPPSTTVFIDRLAAADIPICSLNLVSYKNFPQALLRLRKELLRSHPDVIHSHMVHANLLTRLVRLLIPSLKIVCTAHSIYEGGKLRDWAYRLTNSLSQMNTTISKAATHRFSNENVFPKNRIRTVPNGIDTEKFIPNLVKKHHDGPFRWLAVGRLVEQKDYPTLISAFCKIENSILYIVGKGTLYDTLKLQVNHVGLNERVYFLGEYNNIEKLYCQVDGFVLSSKSEGYGLVVAEAMACELPVVVTDSGGPSEIIGSGDINGLLVPIKNPDALAQAMTKIESMSYLERLDMGRKARQRIKDKYSIERIVEQWEQLYVELKNNR
ncbi:glycosyltransferase [Providencia rettgeri]|uniref:glycosyltransferase n=1 Tax=Providencia rettgeri TaxID=587 RepID=UPI001EFCA6B5|nr:glycosyltransferase [Providencia rettgeri]MCG9528882.1 glycosyltransferase [Providencia rettgeri]